MSERMIRVLQDIVVVRGGGDIATGIVQKLHRSGFKVLVLESAVPTAIRRPVALSEAVYEGKTTVEDLTAIRTSSLEEINTQWNVGNIPVAVDPEASYIAIIKPQIVVDAIIAKRNIGTNKNMAPITIGVGPGFMAGEDVDIVIETMRGHNLGRLIFQGEAQKNTGIPGSIMGYTKERVIHSPSDGVIQNVKDIGDIVNKGELIAYVGDAVVEAPIYGILRGIIRNKIHIKKGLKIADIDPRVDEVDNCFTISDKARTIGGAVLEAVLYMKSSRNDPF
jgi:xanthine dehydrogenase accessory factor